VHHALAAALRSYLDDWRLFLCMLETQQLRGGLDLTSLTFYTQQPAATLRLLAEVAAEAAHPDKSSTGAAARGSGWCACTAEPRAQRSHAQGAGCMEVECCGLAGEGEGQYAR
jgi:hypothetical protein